MGTWTVLSDSRPQAKTGFKPLIVIFFLLTNTALTPSIRISMLDVALLLTIRGGCNGNFAIQMVQSASFPYCAFKYTSILSTYLVAKLT